MESLGTDFRFVHLDDGVFTQSFFVRAVSLDLSNNMFEQTLPQEVTRLSNLGTWDMPLLSVPFVRMKFSLASLHLPLPLSK